MERLLDDEANSSAASQNQMIILANQIIAAMPDRIKQSPAHTLDENNVAMEVSTRNITFKPHYFKIMCCIYLILLFTVDSGDQLCSIISAINTNKKRRNFYLLAF